MNQQVMDNEQQRRNFKKPESVSGINIQFHCTGRSGGAGRGRSEGYLGRPNLGSCEPGGDRRRRLLVVFKLVFQNTETRLMSFG